MRKTVLEIAKLIWRVSCTLLDQVVTILNVTDLKQTIEQAIANNNVERYHFTLLRNLYEKTAM
jgi:hypothetical protein